MLLLHILLTILKILGILLLIAAGLLLLIVLALLFVPVTYTVQGDKSQETWGISGRVSWLFGGISARFWHRGETGWELRLLGIPVRKLMRRLRGGKRRKRQEKKTSSGRKEKGAICAKWAVSFRRNICEERVVSFRRNICEWRAVSFR